MNVTTEILKPFLLALIPAIISGVGLWLQDWRQAHNQRFQRKQARDEAEELIGVLEKWVQAEQSISPPEELVEIKLKARLQLDQAFDNLQLTHEHKSDVQSRPFLQRALLWYRPVSALGWFVHILFYSLLILYFVFAPFVLTAPSDSGSLQWTDLLANIFWLGVLSVPILIVRAWATALDKKKQDAPGTVAPPPAPSMVRTAQSSQVKPQ